MSGHEIWHDHAQDDEWNTKESDMESTCTPAPMQDSVVRPWRTKVGDRMSGLGGSNFSRKFIKFHRYEFCHVKLAHIMW